MKYFSISSKNIIEQSIKLGFEVDIVSKEKNLFYIKGNGKEILFKSTDFGGNSALGYKLCDDKELTYKILDRYNLPIAKSIYLAKDEFEEFDKDSIKKLNFPLIVKPIDEGHGNGVLMGISDFHELKNNLEKSFDIYDNMIIQEQVNGDEIRVLVIKGKIVTAINRVPAFVIGNGKNNIKELIEIENNTNPLRGEGYNNPLTYIKIDNELLNYIKKNNFDLDFIPEDLCKIQLRGNSNVGTGGIPVDVTDLISNNIKQVAINATKALGMEICGVDILTSDFTKSLNETGGVILECNATPGLPPIGQEKTKLALEIIFDLK